MNGTALLGVVLVQALAVAPAAAAQQAPRPPVSAAASAATTATVSQAVTGNISGTVMAPDAARLPGATVTVTDALSGRSVVVVTARHGGYSGSDLPPGEYDVTVELPGFQAQTIRGVRVNTGETRELNFVLQLSTFTETVNVQAGLVRDDVASSEVRDSSAKDIGEALGELNGVSFVRKGAIANDIVLQGFQSRNLAVLIDGERIYGACPNGMDPAVFHADFAEVDHLEVAKGPFDVRYQGSLGGLVNVVTRAPGAGLHTSTNVSTGSWGYVNPSLVASVGSRGLSVLGGYSYRAANPYHDGAGNLFTSYANYRPAEVGSTAFEVRTGWAKVYFSPRPNHAIQVAYTRQQAEHVLYPYLQMDGLTDRANRLRISYGVTRDHSRIKAVSAKVYYSGVDHWMTDALRVTSAGMAREYSMGTQASTGTTGGRLEVTAGVVTAGVEAFRRDWDAATVMAGSKYVPQYSIPSATTDHVGLFVDRESSLGSRTRLAAGARFDYARSGVDAAKANTDLYFAYNGTRSVSATDTGASGKIRVTRQVGSRFEILGGLGRTYRVPDAVERYFALKRMGSDWVGNPGLRPTRNTGFQAGANYRHGRVLASGTVRHDWVSDFVTIHGQPRSIAVPGIMNATAR
ncbi:MAG: TonB dependent receptor, partial [candidate division NC10 bacterium]|nr:TonB dependent receptor [candidate division NC10 bacterium]